MAKARFADLASTTLSAPYVAGSGSMSVSNATAYGNAAGQWPVITGGDFFFFGINNPATAYYKCTSTGGGSQVWTVAAVAGTTDVNLPATTTKLILLVNRALLDLFHQLGAADLTQVDMAPANVDGVAGVASLRTLGSGAQQAMAGNATPGGPPTGAAGGELAGTYPNPTLAEGVIVDADINAAAAILESKLALATDAAAGIGSRRTIGTGALQATAGNDSRLSDSRAPTGTAGGTLSGTYPNPLPQNIATNPPVGGAHVKYELCVDNAGTLYICTVAGTPGTWIQVGAGTVTSVAMTVPSILSVAGSPITGAGTLAVTLATETANQILAGPASGGAVTPTFRALVNADIPSPLTIVGSAATLVTIGSAITGSNHVVHTGLAPGTIVNGTNCTGTYIGTCTDHRGIINIVVAVGATAANAALVTIPFSATLAAQPAILLTQIVDGTATGLPVNDYYVDQTTSPTAQFVIKNIGILAIGTYRVAYAIPYL